MPSKKKAPAKKAPAAKASVTKASADKAPVKKAPAAKSQAARLLELARKKHDDGGGSPFARSRGKETIAQEARVATKMK